jgi:itaconyl-CoA hydratase
MVSTLTLQRAIGMASKTFGRRKSISRFDEIVMTGPVFGGDTLYAESEILHAGDGDAASGSVSVQTCMVKPDGAEVARLKYSVPVYRRGCGPHQDDGEPVSEPRFAAYHEDGDGFLVEQAGLFFEDFAAGETFIHYPRRSMSWTEAVRHSRRALELSPQVYDPMWIDRSEGGVRQIPEALLIGAATALTTRTFGRVVANLGWYDVVLAQAVVDGDTVEAVSEVVDARPSRSREAEGILTVNTHLFNQRHEAVLSFQRKLLVCCRSAQSLYTGAAY